MISVAVAVPAPLKSVEKLHSGFDGLALVSFALRASTVFEEDPAVADGGAVGNRQEFQGHSPP